MYQTDKKRLLIFEIIGAILVAGLAFVFHYLYEWSGENYFVGLISAVNESVFEHTKIIFFPYVIYSFIEYFFVDVDPKRYFVAKSLTSILIVVLVITVFYTYTGIIGEHIVLVDIICSVVYVFIAFFLSYKLITSDAPIEKLFPLALVLFLVVLFAEVFFTINPPKLPLFYDTQGQFYGIPE